MVRRLKLAWNDPVSRRKITRFLRKRGVASMYAHGESTRLTAKMFGKSKPHVQTMFTKIGKINESLKEQRRAALAQRRGASKSQIRIGKSANGEGLRKAAGESNAAKTRGRRKIYRGLWRQRGRIIDKIVQRYIKGVDLKVLGEGLDIPPERARQIAVNIARNNRKVQLARIESLNEKKSRKKSLRRNGRFYAEPSKLERKLDLERELDLEDERREMEEAGIKNPSTDEEINGDQ